MLEKVNKDFDSGVRNMAGILLISVMAVGFAFVFRQLRLVTAGRRADWWLRAIGIIFVIASIKLLGAIPAVAAIGISAVKPLPPEADRRWTAGSKTLMTFAAIIALSVALA